MLLHKNEPICIQYDVNKIGNVVKTQIGNKFVQ